MKKITQVLIFVLGITVASQSDAQKYNLTSPDGKVVVDIENGSSLHFSVRNENEIVIPDAEINMEIDGRNLLSEKKNKIKKSKKNSVNEQIHPPVAIKNAVIENEYQELQLQYKKDFSVVFRAYNDAVTYRFETGFKDTITVKDERLDIELPENAEAWFTYIDRWMNNYEKMYEKEPVSKLTSNKTTHLPLLVDLKNRGKLLITESDLTDYPGLYFTGEGGNHLKSILPPRVKTEKQNVKGESNWDRTIVPESSYDYIARTSGNRTFPWRIFALSANDVDLLNNEIVYKLAEPSRLKETDWIKPGQVAWDWWNYWNVTGVDFRAGVNNDTYKYYIDFASENKIPYIMMDEGWYELGDVTKRVPGIDVKEIVEYGKKKNVGVILWNVWKTLDDQMDEAMDLFGQWGVKGIKVDFMDRDDQDVVNFYYRCAKAAAEHHLFVDFHGAYKPSGIQRTYPNVVNFEGVVGLENAKWSEKANPDNAVILPFIRMFTGPMDYTPGAMRNAQKSEFRAINHNPMSMGTRCQQLAMYILYEAPLQMLADNPTAYKKEQESLDFITSVPTTWDETLPLSGEIGKYVVIARRKGSEYFVGAMTNWEARNLAVDFSFLPEGEWNMEIFQDGINADRNGIDYKKTVSSVTNTQKIDIHLAPGGGWAARIYR